MKIKLAFWVTIGVTLFLTVLIGKRIPQLYREWRADWNSTETERPFVSPLDGPLEPELQAAVSNREWLMWVDWRNGQTNFLTIYLSNRVVIYPPGIRSYPMIQFTDKEWNLITNYYTDRDTNTEVWIFWGSVLK